MGIIYKNGIPYGNQPSTDAVAMIEPSEEASATSAHAYAVGEHFIYNGTLYRATAAIAIGDTITPDTNCVATNVMSEVESGGGGGGGTSDYTQLSNKPQINGVTLTGNKSLSDIGAASQSDLEDLEDITGDGQLSGFTATDLTGAANELRNTLNSKADQDDLTSLNLIGTTNTTGNQIDAGMYFYLNGSLVKALLDIADGATFTNGTNYEMVTAGGLNEFKNVADKKLSFQRVSTSPTGRPWPCGDIGYVILSGLLGNVGAVLFLIDLYFGVSKIINLPAFQQWTNTSAFSASWNDGYLTLKAPYTSEFIMVDFTRNGQ